MSKKLLIPLVFFTLVILSVAFLLARSETIKPAQPQNITAGNPVDDTAPATNQAGTYTDYQENSIASTGGTKILFFHAQWCPQCRQLEASIKAGNIPADVTILKVDYDHAQELRQKYGVTLQTTLVKVDDQGNLVKKFIAYDDPTLDALKAQLL